MKEDSEYMIDHIVRQVGKGANNRYVRRWCGYTAASEAIEPSANTPTHFIKRCGRKKAEDANAPTRGFVNKSTEFIK